MKRSKYSKENGLESALQYLNLPFSHMCYVPASFCITTYFFHWILPPVNFQTGCCTLLYVEIVHTVDIHCPKEPVLYTQKRSTQYQQSAGKENVNRNLVNTRFM